jgi:hypothetical protein
MRQFNMGRIWESGNFDITFKQLRSNLKFRGLFPLPIGSAGNIAFYIQVLFWDE